MKAVIKYHSPGPGNIDVLDVDEPVCGANQVKVEIAFCGVCGTDLHVLHDTFRNYPPVILGHECAGTVGVEVGRSVTGVNLGDRVTILGATAVTCGHCQYCRSGHFIFCKARRGNGARSERQDSRATSWCGRTSCIRCRTGSRSRRPRSASRLPPRCRPSPR